MEKTFVMKMDRELHDRVAEYAEQRGESMAELVRTAVDSYVPGYDSLFPKRTKKLVIKRRGSAGKE